jgi:hypothetical protein
MKLCSPVVRWLWPALCVLLGLGCQEQPAPSPSTSAAAKPAQSAAPSAAPAALAPPPPASVTAAPSEAPPESISAQHILVAYRGAKGAPKTVTRSKPDAKKRAEEVLAKAKSGEDFTALVKAYSEDPGSAERLGSLGKFKRDGMVKPFSDAAFALKVDEVSGIVETPFGFHIIKRNQ